jgi:hypothetical protein
MTAMVPLLLVFTVRVMWPIAALFAAFAGLTIATFLSSRRILSMTTRWYFVVLALMTVMLLMMGLIFGPLLLLPVFITGSIGAWLVIPIRFSKMIVIGFHALAIVPLLALEYTGALPSTFAFEAHRIVFEPWVLDLTPAMAVMMYAIALGTQVASQINLMGVFKRTVEDAQDRRHAQAWHLEQLLPKTPAPK